MQYFTINELCKSTTANRNGIDNTPPSDVVDSLTYLVDNLLDPIRSQWGAPIICDSGYRCPALNAAVNGISNSQHMKGEAADIRTLSDSREDNKRLFELIQNSGLEFDQLINEYDYNWIHVSLKRDENRKQILNIG